MTKKPKTSKDAADKVVKNIRRKTRQTYSSEEKIRIVLAGLRGELTRLSERIAHRIPVAGCTRQRRRSTAQRESTESPSSVSDCWP